MSYIKHALYLGIAVCLGTSMNLAHAWCGSDYLTNNNPNHIDCESSAETNKYSCYAGWLTGAAEYCGTIKDTTEFEKSSIYLIGRVPGSSTTALPVSKNAGVKVACDSLLSDTVPAGRTDYPAICLSGYEALKDSSFTYPATTATTAPTKPVATQSMADCYEIAKNQIQTLSTNDKGRVKKFGSTCMPNLPKASPEACSKHVEKVCNSHNLKKFTKCTTPDHTDMTISCTAN